MPSLLLPARRPPIVVDVNYQRHIAMMAAALSDDSRRYISKAEEICEATARLGGFDKQTSAARSSGNTRAEISDRLGPSTHGRGLPGSIQTGRPLSSLQLIVDGLDAKTDLRKRSVYQSRSALTKCAVDRLADLKLSIYDLSKRQLGDLVDEPTSEMEDVNMLLDEMRNALRCMETIVLLETAIVESRPP